MIAGALIFLAGAVMGYLAALYAPKPQPEKPYDKYRNKDGLYTRKTIGG